jgi:hypothetical protein
MRPAPEDNEADLRLVGNLGRAPRGGVDVGEVSALGEACRNRQPPPDVLVHVVVVEVGGGPILGKAGHRGLKRIPVAPAVDVQVRGVIRQAAKRVAESSR